MIKRVNSTFIVQEAEIKKLVAKYITEKLNPVEPVDEKNIEISVNDYGLKGINCILRTEYKENLK